MAYPGKEFFDFLLRHQIYLEGLKTWHQSDAMRYLRDLAKRLRALLGGQSVESLGELTKAKLNAVLRKASELAGKVLGNYGNEFLTEFRRVTRIDTVKQRGVFALLEPEKDVTSVTVGSVWRRVANSPVAAFGKSVKEATEELISVAKESIRKRIVQSAIDNESTGDLVKAIVGDDEEFTNGVLRQARNSIRSHVATAMQHAAAQVTAALGKATYGCYEWISILDSKTSDICRERHRKVYIYDQGPQPPAHPYCRSHTIPCPCDGAELRVPGLIEWLKTQPPAFVEAAFDKRTADALRNGLLEPSTILRDIAVKPLSTEAFETKNLAA